MSSLTVKKIILNMKEQLLVLDARNRLINSTFSTRSEGFLFIDELPQKLAKKLVDGMTFQALPPLSAALKDEKSDQFKLQLEEMMVSDEFYLQEMRRISELDSTDQDKISELENVALRLLKDKVRDVIGLKKRPPDHSDINLKTHAELHNINPSYDLPDPALDKAEHDDKLIQTLFLKESLDLKLKKLKLKAAENLREEGLSTLYICFGFLEYKDLAQQNKKRVAPLILMPIEFDEKRDSFKIKSPDGDIQDNQSLRLFLETRHKLNLPKFPKPNPEDEFIDIEKYFEQVNKLVVKEKGWRVLRRSSIGIFKTSAEVMYEDLKAIADNPSNLLQDLLGGKMQESSDKLFNLQDPEIRRICPALIEPADATQHSAVIDMLQGNSFVLRGPPGTGKSQTICNMIGAGLADGKKILFVARKEAALEVVRSRLTASGLESFLLKTYSAKSNKKPFWDSVKKRMSLSLPNFSASEYEQTIKNIHSTEDNLNKYAEFMKEFYGKSDLTNHDLLWEQGILTEKYPLNWPGIPKLPHPRSYSKSQLKKAIENLNIIESDFDQSFFNHPYVSAKKVPNTNIDQKNFISSMNQWRDSLNSLIKLSDDLKKYKSFTQSEFDVSQTVNDLFLTLEIQNKCLDTGQLEIFLNFFKGDDSDRFDMEHIVEIIIEQQTLLNKLEELNLPVNSLDKVLIFIKNADIFKIDKSRAYQEEFNNLKLSHEIILNTFLPFLDFCTSKELSFKSIEILNSINYEYNNLDSDSRASIQFNKSIFDLVVKKKLDLLIFAKKTKQELLDQNINLEMAKRESPNLKADAKIFNDSNLLSFLTDSNFRKVRRRVKNIFNHPVARKDCADLLFKIDGYLEDESIINIDSSLESLFGMEFAGLDTPEHLVVGLNNFVKSLSKLPIKKHFCETLYGYLLNDTSKFLQSLNETIPSNIDLNHNIFTDLDILSKKDMHTEIDGWKKSSSNLEALIAEGQSLNILEGWTSKSLAKNINLIESYLELNKEIDSAIIQLKISQPIEFKELDLSFFKEDFLSLRSIRSENMQLFLENFDHLSSLHESFASLKNKYLESNGLIEKAMLLIQANPFESNLENVHIEALQSFASISKAIEKDLILYFDFRNKENSLNPIEAKFYSNFCFHKNIATRENLANFFKTWIRDEQYKELLKDNDSASILSVFKGAHLKRLRTDLKNLDNESLDATKKYIAHMTERQIQGAPSGQSGIRVGDKTEMELLAYGCSKKTHPKGAVRDHIKKSASALGHLSPCWMMTPASVSQFLPIEELFDVVIIDEASQMTPPEALGAIARAKQLVVVGDEHQLPPGTWFQSSNENVTDDMDVDIDESILDLAMGVWRNPRMLRYHYRSRHEDLIRFQNNFIYQNQLIIPPTTFDQNSEDIGLGIKTHYLEEASYMGKGQNHDEATYVANLFKKHTEIRPDQSIGIAAVNKAQEELIRQKIEALQGQSKSIRDYFDHWSIKDEGLNRPFIKNLANVQGDERDVIIISTAYGRENPSSAVRNNFGPINSNMGHRWLNVLTTRARDQVHLVTSLLSSDVRNPRYRGAEFLKQYLQFAKDKNLVIGGDSEGEIDNPFEQWAVDQIQSMGFEAVPQVGVRGFQVDIGVKHPSCAGYILGVECDGATYHSSPSARDRDLHRQNLLEGWGWKIHRIWSTDWIWEPDKTKEKLREVLSQTLRNSK